jgi:hypothetical protein
MARPIDTRAAARRISTHLNGLVRDIQTLMRGLQTAALQASAKGAGGAPRRARTLTAKDHARLKLQGEYLGLMRHLPKSHHARVKALRAKRGYPPAIKLARRLLKSA